MTDGWLERGRLALRGLRERGQSEVLGATLLTGIIVILVAVAGLFLFADFGGDDEQLLANIEGEVTATDIELNHEGGDSFDADDIEIVLTGDAERELLLDGDFTSDDDEFAPGSTWTYDTDAEGDDLILGGGRMLVIHQPTNTVLYDDAYLVQILPGGVQLEVESFSASEKQSDQADVYGDGDPAQDDDGIPWDYDVFVDFDDDNPPVRNPSEVDIAFDPDSGTLEHDLDGHNLTAFEPDSSPESITATANIDGADDDDDVVVDVYPVVTGELDISMHTEDGGTLGGSGFELLDDDVELALGETLVVEVDVTATGGAVVEENITIDPGALGETETRTVSADPGETETETLEFETSLTDTELVGTHTVTVTGDGDEVTGTVEVLDPIFFDVNIQNQLQGTVYAVDDEELDVTAEIENTGSAQDTQEIEFTVTDEDGEQDTDTETVTLDGGESETVEFTADLDDLDEDPEVSVSSDNTTAEGAIEAVPEGTDLVAGLENVTADAGDTVTVELGVISLDGEGGDEIGSYNFGVWYDDDVLAFDDEEGSEGVSEGDWEWDSVNDEEDAFGVGGFHSGERPETPSLPALTFEFDVEEGDDAELEFIEDEDGPGGIQESQVNDPDFSEYEVYYDDGEILAGD